MRARPFRNTWHPREEYFVGVSPPTPPQLSSTLIICRIRRNPNTTKTCFITRKSYPPTPKVVVPGETRRIGLSRYWSHGSNAGNLHLSRRSPLADPAAPPRITRAFTAVKQKPKELLHQPATLPCCLAPSNGYVNPITSKPVTRRIEFAAMRGCLSMPGSVRWRQTPPGID